MEPVDMEQFRRLCDEIVAPQLAVYGFRFAGETGEERMGGLREHSLVYCRVRPVDEPQYLLVQVVTILDRHARPDTEWVQVLLGEGAHERPEAGFNSVTIWEMTEAVTGRFETTGYLLGTGDLLRPALVFATRQLLTQAANFLTGDVSAFRSIRARQNAEPRAYPAIMCGTDGRPLDEADRRRLIERLEALRRKYS